MAPAVVLKTSLDYHAERDGRLALRLRWGCRAEQGRRGALGSRHGQEE
jgi:hypothetical protein